MNQADTAETYRIIYTLAALFRRRCYVCHEKCKTGKYFAIHHKKYLPTDKIHSDFASRLDYYRYLEPLVKAEPKRFALVCNTHHQSVTRLQQFKKDKLARLIKLVKQST